jgi:adenylate cyclase class 2
MAFEVEQKFPLDDATAVLARLGELGAVSAGECRQVDRYFNHPARDFATTDEALRIRSVGEDNFVTYKGPKRDATTKTRREIELPLAPGAAAAQEFAELLEVLGFHPVASVHKQRRTFRFGWQGRKFELALDDVDSVGRFVELETIADQAEVAAAQACLHSLAARLDLSQSERRSYLELLLARRQSR